MFRPRPVTYAVCLLAAVLTVVWLALPGGGQASSTPPPVTTRQASAPGEAAEARASEAYGKLPISFVANEGQADERVKFISRGGGYSLSLTPTEAVLVLAGGRGAAASPAEHDDTARSLSPAQEAHVLVMKMVGANAEPSLTGLDELPGKVNYLLGSDPARWRTNVPTYARVKYQGVYDGVDLIYYGNPQKLEYDFVVAPGIDPSMIRLGFEGMESFALNERGDLTLKTAGGEMSLNRPVAYQEVSGRRVEVESRYVINGAREVGFELGDYDESSPLVIDPVLIYSTYLGGNSTDQGHAIAVNSAGNAFVTGHTLSANFPVLSGSLQPTLKGPGADVFVTKLNAAGSGVVYSTYIGGSGVEQALGIAVNSAGQAHVTGSTNSKDFPVANALRPNSGGLTDAFVAKLNATGSALVYSTYLGGASNEIGTAIALDGDGAAYVTGETNSKDFPTLNAFQADKKGTALFITTDGAASWHPGDAGLGGSSVFTLALDPKNSSVVYAGTDAGVYKSTDGGTTWAAATGGLTPQPVYGLAVNPVNTSIVYATTDSGVYKSTDGGSNWAVTGLGSGSLMRSIVINPAAPNTVYVANFVGNLVYKTTDGGANWSPLAVNTYSFIIHGLAIDPSAPANIYAATDRGLFKSDNGGSSWSELNLGLFMPVVEAVAIDKKNPATVYATTSAGVFKSTNRGANWVLLNPSSGYPRFSVLALDPNNSSTMYAGLRSGHTFKSTNGGATWVLLQNSPLPRLNVLLVDPANSAKVYAGGISPSDAFVTKLNAAGSALLYSTFLGGEGQDSGFGVAVGADGSAHVAGSTASFNFPLANALQPAKGDPFSGASDAFVTKLDPAGSALVYSTYLGGDNLDFARGVALDGPGNAYVVGATASTNFPTAGGFQNAHSGSPGNYDAFVTKLNPAGSAIVYSTHLGGDSQDMGNAIAVSPAGAAFVTGSTFSFNFPTTGPGYTTPANSPQNAFVTQLSPAGSGLVYSLLVGGAFGEDGRAIALDSADGVYVAGFTDSPNFPTANAQQATLGGNTDAFVFKLRPSADIAVTMTDAPDPVVLGKNLTYTINVNNVGDLPATNVTLQDALPAGATFVSVATNRGTCSGTSNVTCNLGNLAPGEGAVVTIVIKPPTVKTISNTASATCAEPDGTPGNNSATQTTDVSFAALSVVKQVVYDQVAPGSKVAFFVTATNNDGVTATNVVVADSLPAELTFYSCKAEGGTCGGTGSNRTITFPSLPVGQSARAVIIATVKPDAAPGTVISNTATVRSATPDSTAGDNTSTAKATVNPTPIKRRAPGKIAFASDRAFSNSTQPSGIYTIYANGTGDKLLIGGEPFGAPPAWSPDGTRIAYGRRVDTVNDEIYVARSDGSNPIKVADNVSSNTTRIAWSPSGSMLAYIGSDDFSIHLANADGTGHSKLPNSPQFISDLAWSPDGSKFAYSDASNVFVMNLDGSGRKNLTANRTAISGEPAAATLPRWSPDGTRLLFQATSSSYADTFIMNADGTGMTRLLNVPRSESAAWSPDGSRVVFVMSNELWVSRLDGSGLVQVTKNGFYNNSPDWQAQPGVTPAPKPDPTPVKTYTIKGHVNVFTEIRLTGTRTGSRYTDWNGDYEFVNLPEGGDYTVTPADPSYTFSPAKRTFTDLAANQTGADFTGTFSPASISGHIKDEAGNPMANVKVKLVGGLSGSTLTDANGYYIFPNVPRYRGYVISVDWPGPYGYSPPSYTFENLMTSQTADFVGSRQPSHVIGGRITQNEEPTVGVAGVTVGLAAILPNGATFIFVETDANGYFTFGEQKDGFDYEVSAYDTPGYFYAPVNLRISKLRADQHLKFVRYPLDNFGDITGQIVDTKGQPVEGVTMTLSGGLNTTAVSDYEGNYYFGSMPTGVNYNVKPSKAGYYFIPSSAAVNNLTTAGKVANFTASRTGLQFSAANFNVQEGVGAAVVSVRRVGDSTGAVSVKYATSNGTAAAGSDYTTATGTVTFAPGETVKTFSVPVTDDSLDEANETIKLTLSAPAGGAGLGSMVSATVTIADNDLPPIASIEDVTVTEPAAGQTATATFTVTLSEASGQNVYVKYATADGTAAAPGDYTARIPTVLIIAPGLTSKTFTVTVRGDAVTEADETFTVLLSSPTNATIATGQATGTIKDAAPAPAQAEGAETTVEFAEAAYNAAEDDGRVEITVRRSGDLSAALAVDYETADATATDRSDYGTALGRLSFAPGEDSKSLSLIITDDAHAEGDESLRLRLSLPDGGAALGQNSEAEVTLADNDRVDGASNPLDDFLFFVRQQFVDLLGREPGAEELSALAAKLNECPAGDATCGREAVTAGLLLSDEYQNRARLVYGLYKIALGREPQYREFVREMRSAAEAEGADSAAQMRRYTEQWLKAQGARTDREFTTSLRVSAAALKGRTRAELLLEVIGRNEVREKLRAESLVLVHYFNFLRRDPEDEGRKAWAAAAGDALQLVSGFINSSEYRQRFGQ